MPLALPPATIKLGLLALACGASAGAWSQARIQGLEAGGVGATLHIEQTGAARLGVPDIPLIAQGDALRLTVRQVGASAAQLQLRTADAAGSAGSRVLVEQRGETGQAVTGAQLQLHAGLEHAVSALDLSLRQQGDGASAELRLGTFDAVHGATVALEQAVAAQARLELASGNNAWVSWTQGAGASGSLFSTGHQLSAQITQAAGSTVALTNAGDANTYRLATQLPGDTLTLNVAGSGNTFSFDFLVGSAPAYQALSWGTAGMPAQVKGGDFEVARFGDPGRHFYAVYDKTNANPVAAASAIVTPRP